MSPSSVYRQRMRRSTQWQRRKRTALSLLMRRIRRNPRLKRLCESSMNNSSLPPDHRERLNRARLALEGLSVGDALGETCFQFDNYQAVIEDPRATARGPWPWTDDTAMALGIFEVLEELGAIDQDRLAKRFASRWQAAPWRGYGAGA